MNLRNYYVLCLAFVAAIAACSKGQTVSPDGAPAAVAVELSQPMASFARMVSGQWRVTAPSGTSMFHTWHWGPGNHSIRRMTTGFDAAGSPWRELRVAFWHPARKQLRFFGMTPVGRGVMEGTIKFERETANATFDLFQSSGRRDMRLRWAFDGPDKYHEKLLEATGPAGIQLLAEWDHVRSPNVLLANPPLEIEAKPSQRLKFFDPVVGSTWEGRSSSVSKDASDFESTFEWLPLIETVYAQVRAPDKAGPSKHILDAYFYHHTGTNTLRCLALSHLSGVYEGDVTTLDNGGLQLDLKRYEGDQVVSLLVLLDFDASEGLRTRVWTLDGVERTLSLDVHQTLAIRAK